MLLLQEKPHARKGDMDSKQLSLRQKKGAHLEEIAPQYI
jgi:hypothetical protein